MTADHQVYDWLILLDREVEHVWRREWSATKVLFIVSRYGPFVDMPIMMISESGPDFCIVQTEGNADRGYAVRSTHRSVWRDRLRGGCIGCTRRSYADRRKYPRRVTPSTESSHVRENSTPGVRLSLTSVGW